MTELSRRKLCRCARSRAERALARVLDERTPRGAAEAAIELPIAVQLPSLDVGIALARDVCAHLSPLRGTRPIGVRWEPAGAGPFPRFSGHLDVSADTNDSCWLDLRGSYEHPAPTLHLLDRAETALGHRIAVAIARRLLDELCTAVEAADALTA